MQHRLHILKMQNLISYLSVTVLTRYNKKYEMAFSLLIGCCIQNVAESSTVYTKSKPSLL